MNYVTDSGDQCNLCNNCDYCNIGDGFSFFHTNIRSIDSNFDYLDILLQRLNLDLDVIGLTETWEMHSKLGKNIINYNVESCKDLKNKCSGVSLYVHKKWSYVVLDDIKSHACDSVFVEIVNSKFEKVIVGVVYRSDSNSWEEFVASWCIVLDKFVAMSSNVLIFGDFNANVKNGGDDRGHLLLEESGLRGFRQLIEGITRPSSSGGSTIDLVFTNIDVHSNNFILQSQLSDHFPTVGVLCDYFKCVSDGKCVDQYEKFDKARFLCELRKCNFDDILSCNDVDVGVGLLTGRVRQCLDLSTVRGSKFKRYCFPKKPWLSAAMLKCLRKRDKMKNLLNRNINNLFLRKKYVLYRNTLNKAIDAARKKYFENKIKSCGNDTKMIWDSVNQVIRNDGLKGASAPPNKIVVDGILFTDKKVIADKFNDYFLNVGVSSVNSNVYDNFGVKNLKSIFLAPVTDMTVMAILRSLKSKHSKGVDGISNYILKLGREYLCSSITYLINLMLSSGKFPNGFKEARICLLHKGGKKSDMCNYRPIAVLCAMGKIFERVLYNQISGFLEKEAIFCESQFGYRANKSTECAVASIADYIREALAGGEFAAMLSLDVRKAFDSVNHELLLKKLYYLGIRGLPLELIRSYFDGRSQYISFGDVHSDKGFIKAGVPQGSVLGPLFFIIFMNDLVSVTTGGKVVMYADDTAVCLRGLNLVDVMGSMQSLVDNMVAWYDDNGLLLNGKKSKLVIFGLHHKLIVESVRMHTYFIVIKHEFILPEESIKYLGIVFDNEMKWFAHVSYIRNRLSRVLGLFFRLRKYFSKAILMMLYYSLFQSIIGYGLIVYGNTFKSRLKSIQIMQKKVVRVINFYGHRQSVKVLMNTDGVMSVFKLFVYQMTILAAKVWEGITQFDGVFLVKSVRVNSMRLRPNVGELLQVPLAKSAMKKQCLSVRLPVIVNYIWHLGVDIFDIQPFGKKRREIKKCVVCCDEDDILLKLF